MPIRPTDPDLRHRLYEQAVQTPEHDIATLEGIFARRVGRAPLSLREDFCGTGLLGARWIESDDEREAVCVDLDPEVLAYGRRHHLAALDEDEEDRIRLVRGDVRALSDRAFDLIVAMNFSWALFDDASLSDYLGAARACLEDDGLLVLELFGGADLRRARRQLHAHEGFTYEWEQRAFDAEREALDARIHFALDDGTALRDAFTYRFRLRPIARLVAMLEAAGLREPELHVEDRRGRYAVRRGAKGRGEPRAPLWRGLLVAGP